MKILQSSDWHLGEYNGPNKDNVNLRFQNILTCLDEVIRVAEQERPDAILLPGDLTNKSKLWGDQTLRETRIIANTLISLSKVAPVVAMFGTANHDSAESFKTLEKWLSKTDRIKIVYQPELFTLNTAAGHLQIGAVPGFDKGHFLANNPGLDSTEANRMASQGLGDIIRAFGTQLDPNIPSALMSHYTVAGSEYDNGNTTIFLESEVVLTPEAIDTSGFTIVTLGHIHKPQKVVTCSTPTYYSGAIENLNFNDEGSDKGFWIHELEDNIHKAAVYYPTPAIQFLTVRPNEQDIREYLDAGCTVYNWLPQGKDFKDKIVRVRYTAAADDSKRIDRAKIERELYDAGAFWISEIVADRIVEELTRTDLDESMEPEQTLERWMDAKGYTQEYRNELRLLSTPIIQSVTASKATGRHVGIFEPLALEVKNYRSYLEESVDFTKIRFATVNGPNGIGKSSLFMDAIYDCLYEDPREGELTGWINDSELVRSGAIAFTFRMGESQFKVQRSRTKGGKVTLNLSEEVNGEWQDRSGDKTVETQSRIEQLIGMDKTTFKSCALIMQDAYAVFLEADKSERMSVLGNTIGLGIYEDLHEQTKKMITDVNREINNYKDRIRLLEERANKELELNQQFLGINDELNRLREQILHAETEMAALSATLKHFEDKQAQIIELQEKVTSTRQKYNQKSNQKKEIESQMAQDTILLDKESDIMAAAEEVDLLKDEITRLTAIQPQLTEAQNQKRAATLENMKVTNELSDLQVKISGMKITDEVKAEILAKAGEYQAAVNLLEEMNIKYIKDLDFDKQINAAVNELDKARDRLQSGTKQRIYAIDELEKKSAMLNDANCIDISKATCKFLADAVKANQDLPKSKAELELFEKSIEQEFEPLQKKVDDLKFERETLSFDPESFSAQQKLVATLKAYETKAHSLEANKIALESMEAMEVSHKERIDQLAITLQEWTTKETNLSKQLIPLFEHQTRVAELKDTAALKDQVPVAKDRKSTAEIRLSEFETEILELSTEGITVSVKLDSLRREITDMDDVILKSSIKSAQIENMKLEERNLNSKLGAVTHQLDEIKETREQIKTMEVEMAVKSNESARLTHLGEGFSNEGIPFLITKAIVPELESNANVILSQMTGGKMQIEMKTEKQLKSKKEINTLEVWIKTDSVARPYLSFSGGQKVKVALAVAFALAQLKAKRAGVQLGMLFIDEPPFLDNDGTEAYADALETMATMFPTMRILSISHDQVMKARFLQNIQVISTDQGSKLVM